MKHIHPLRYRKTSVSLPHASYRRLRAVRIILVRHSIRLSEQELYNHLFKEFLKSWRGSGKKTNNLRRYNAKGKEYKIRPLYINQVMYAALWQRALHSGESISRMLDLAIRVYLPRLLEDLLYSQQSLIKSSRTLDYWKARYGRRKNRYAGFFINYVCKTVNNDQSGLEYAQSMQIISKAGLSAMQIWNLMHMAA